MTYITISTKNRFWWLACTLQCVANRFRRASEFVHVIDDGSDQMIKERRAMYDHLLQGGILDRVDVTPARGLCASRARFLEVFRKTSKFTEWAAFDDDLLFAPNTIINAVTDLNTMLGGDGVVLIYVNPWTQTEPWKPGFELVHKTGWAAFVMGRRAIESFGNPYAKDTGQDEKVSFWERRLQEQRTRIIVNRRNPPLCQHMANSTSLLFGDQPTWKEIFAVNPETQEPLAVPPHTWREISSAADNEEGMERFVRRRNEFLPQRILLPPPRGTLEP